MTRLKFIANCILPAIFLSSCSEILEPVSLFADKQYVEVESIQENFKIKIEGLTFATSKKANTAPYPRQVILTGNGSKAKVLDEAGFLKSDIPKSLKNQNYLLGIGDQLSFIQMNEFETKIPHWPTVSKKSEYLLGTGDKLELLQSFDNTRNLSVTFDNDGKIISPNQSNNVFKTGGVIGSNGNILLFGLGNIVAANRTLEHVRTDVRNILLRNGLAPNFQLEITEFNSQKAFVTNGIGKSNSLSLSNLPISLKEVALEAGLSESEKSFAQIKLTRDSQEYSMTAGQLFSPDAPDIFIKDKDQIQIQTIPNRETNIQTFVGSKGYILLPDVGRITAVEQTIDNVRNKISKILNKKGIKPNFQLELTKAVSKKAYLIQKNVGNTVIPLKSSEITLRKLIIESQSSLISNASLSTVTLKRNGQVFRMTKDYILDPNTADILVINDDQIEVENLAYKPGKVFALSGAGSAQILPIDPSKRETLADILFVPNGPLSNLFAKRSEIYLLRGRNPSIAYHLDAQSVSRILVAAKTELRPNDIVYVAERPIVSFSRTLAEISPLRILLRDIQNNNIP